MDKNYYFKRGKRLVAKVMTFVIAFSMIYDLPVTTNAAVHFIVRDEKGNVINGANVDYSVNSVSEGDDYIVNHVGQTDADGKVMLVPDDDYIDNDLSVNASISKEGYTSVSYNGDIDSSDQEIGITLNGNYIEGVSVSGLDVTYGADGVAWLPAIVTGTGADDTVTYSVDGGVASSTETISIPNTYTVVVTVSRPGCLDKVETVTSVIKKGERTLAFVKGYGDEISVPFVEGSSTENDFDFSAVCSPNATITYGILEGAEGMSDTIDNYASIDASGLLHIKKAGNVVRVVSTVAGDAYYNGKTVTCDVTVQKQGTVVYFENSSVDVKFGQNIQCQKAKKDANDNGQISYSAYINGENINGKNLGIQLYESGTFTVDKNLLNQTLCNNSGSLSISVKASKTAGTKNTLFGKNKTLFNSGEAYYVLNIALEATPDASYTMQIDGSQVTSPNGTNGWFNKSVTVIPASNYKIAKDSPNNSFGNTVVFDNQGSAQRYIYLQSTDGGITAPILVDIAKIDSVKPIIEKIEYSTPDYTKQNTKSLLIYDEPVVVTFTANDETSGVVKFNWAYTRSEGVSGNTLDTYSGEVTAVRDPQNAKRYTASISLPSGSIVGSQLRGYLSVTATDAAGLVSNEYVDGDKVIIVDTISPTQTVTYQLVDSENDKMQMVGEHYYYSGDVKFIFDITEANFFDSDVIIKVKKNNESPVELNGLVWKNLGNDKYETDYTLQGDGDYIVTMEYKDAMNHQNGAFVGDTNTTVFTSNLVTIDEVNPIVDFVYNDFEKQDIAQTAEITITEHNFRASDVEIGAVILDVTGKHISNESTVLSNLNTFVKNEANWQKIANDKYKVVIANDFVDGNYKLTVNYKDLALNEADTVESDVFIVDKTAPSESDMSISYSTPVLDAIIEGITFGYYNPNVTVTFTAFDITSGVKSFKWDYVREDGVSEINVDKYAESELVAIQDSVDLSKYEASVVLPKELAEQLRGRIGFIATDRCSNSSNKVTDENNIIVVDTIAPTMDVEYSIADNSFEDKDYYNKDLSVTFTVTEANFYSEDVLVKVKKNDGEAEIVEPEWTDESTDVHVGKIVIAATDDHKNDGDYVFSVEYADRSNNELAEYSSNTKVIDTTKPVIEVEYANKNAVNELSDVENHMRKYFASTQTATVTIIEHNFNVPDVKYTIVAKDVSGNPLNASSLYTASSWTKNGDKNILTITYPGNANYTFDIEYTDLAMLKADEYATNYFTVDTTKPTDLKITYSDSVLETVLSAISFGFYNAKTKVTIIASDNISGINSMKYSYVKADGVSGVNAELADVLIDASAISNSNGGATGTATFEIPKNALVNDTQFNGTVNFTATDRANNEADYFKDVKRIVVDNIAPTADVQYNAPVQILNGISYYDGDISATVTINEANFYPEDVHISVIKDGVESAINASWSDNNTDVHVGTFTLSGDGDYSVNITYSDKSTNVMTTYTSEPMVIDTEIVEAVITVNGQEADGKAFKDEVVPAVSFNDKNFESCEIKLYRTSYGDKNVDVTEKFIAGHISLKENGGSGEFDTFDKLAENDGIYTLTTELRDKAGHVIENSITFTVNRFGSVYEYNDLLISLISDGGAYVQSVDGDLVITEYNADKLLSNSLNIEILRDGKPIDNTEYKVTPDINETVATGSSGWYQYSYTIAKENFEADGVYKIAVSSKDATGNSPENNNYKDKNILFRVDSTVPEITSISGLEKSVINATEQTVKYTVYDTIALDSIEVYVNGKQIENIVDFSEDANNYTGTFLLKENSSAQKIRLVVIDKAGNITDTDAADFVSSYAFSSAVTVSTNMFVRWFANKTLFYGSIAAGIVVILGGFGIVVLLKKRKNKVKE